MTKIDSNNNDIAVHYTSKDLGDTILAALERAGKDLKNLKLEDLAPVDEFHIRGHEATVELAKQLKEFEGDASFNQDTFFAGVLPLSTDKLPRSLRKFIAQRVTQISHRSHLSPSIEIRLILFLPLW